MTLGNAATDFSGLDDAEAFPSDFPVGKHLIKVQKNDVYTIKGDTHMAVYGEVVQTDNPGEVKVGSVYKAKISYLVSRQYPDGQKGMKILRTYLAAALGVSPDGPPPQDVAKTWGALANTVINEDPKAMEGDMVLVVATEIGRAHV